MHIGDNIRYIRTLRGIKQELIAQRIGVTQQEVSRIEKSSMISVKRLKAIAKILRVPIKAIRRFDPEKALDLYIKEVDRQDLEDILRDE